MIRLNSKWLMLLFGFTMIGALAIFLMVFQGSPGELSAAHASVIGGSSIFSCKQCHAAEGLTLGCLNCHTEISGQLNEGNGYHAYLLKDRPTDCKACHSEHLGSDFPLVSTLSWRAEPTNRFSHPHVEFTLTGAHDELACGKCHMDKVAEAFALPGYPEHHREATMLGLRQACSSCHEDIHQSGELTKDCSKCHSQNIFKPAPHFNHDDYFILEGEHARAACSACHETDQAMEVTDVLRGFGSVKGKSCVDCHESPHSELIGNDCASCHTAADSTWTEGVRGVDTLYHARFGFVLDPPHAHVECAACHDPEKPYADRYMEPSRHPDQCRACHADPHGGQFMERHSRCLDCHDREHFVPSTVGLLTHSKTYPLQGGHQAVACIQCHRMDEQTGVRQFAGTPAACKDCHENPHGNQFDVQLEKNDCTVCHQSNFSSFEVFEYTHQNRSAFFLGKGHMQADCRGCHSETISGQSIDYRATPTECSACHQDIHRGQFILNEAARCERCHASMDAWTAENFVHDRDAQFALEGAHAKVECKACHQPVPQRDGRSVIQYCPLTTRCEDCHGFDVSQ